LSSARILVVDDDQHLRETLSMLVRRLGHDITSAASVTEARALLDSSDFDLVISDLRMDDGTGVDLLRHARQAGETVPFIILTAYATVESAVDAMKEGAFDYLQKPFDKADVQLRIERALAERLHRIEHDYLRETASLNPEGGEIIGVSGSFRAILDMVHRVAQSDASVLITGETGTGKGLIARAIHNASERAERLLVPLNLSALPEELVETELFGHTRGAFTGAVAHREGKFEVAHGGTLFLDEVGDVPLRVQPKLLQALEEQLIERVGSNQSRKVDVRIISATNRDLEAGVNAGEFRKDLYYRLRVVEIKLPPLRQRREDISYLVAHFLRGFSKRRARGVPAITDAALRMLEEYDWPGNIRQLRNTVERALVLCTRDVIDTSLLDLGAPEASHEEQAQTLHLETALDRLEKETILRALEQTDGVKTRAARLLGVSGRTLWYKLRKHGVT
jgi:DNA-binding NtrC family response regulator